MSYSINRLCKTYLFILSDTLGQLFYHLFRFLAHLLDAIEQNSEKESSRFPHLHARVPRSARERVRTKISFAKLVVPLNRFSFPAIKIGINPALANVTPLIESGNMARDLCLIKEPWFALWAPIKEGNVLRSTKIARYGLSVVSVFVPAFTEGVVRQVER